MKRYFIAGSILWTAVAGTSFAQQQQSSPDPRHHSGQNNGSTAAPARPQRTSQPPVARTQPSGYGNFTGVRQVPNQVPRYWQRNQDPNVLVPQRRFTQPRAGDQPQSNPTVNRAIPA